MKAIEKEFTDQLKRYRNFLPYCDTERQQIQLKAEIERLEGVLGMVRLTGRIVNDYRRGDPPDNELKKSA